MNRLIRAGVGAIVFVPNQIAALAGNVATALIQIWANKIRSLLTVLGIIIAVTSIIVVVWFVQGLGDYYETFLVVWARNLMVVYPQWQRNARGDVIKRAEMTMEDIRAIDVGTAAIRRTAPRVWSRGKIEYGRQQVSDVQVVGSNEFFQAIRNFYVDAGRFYGAIDVQNATSVVVVGREVLHKLQADEAIVEDYIHVDGQRFRVVGLLEAKGSFMGDNQDELVIIPWTTALKMYPWARNFLGCYVEAVDESKIPDAEEQMVRVLRTRHDIKPGEPNDFGIFKQDQVLQEFGRVRTIATSVLAGIVSISLLVGGIGIMNVMLVSVTERTREIGLRKSIGARRRDILLQFLTEAVVLATVGGLIGIVLGYAIGFVASMHPQMVSVNVPIWSVVLALGFSAGVGIFFGIVPAFKAAIVHPIDALRHE